MAAFSLTRFLLLVLALALSSAYRSFPGPSLRAIYQLRSNSATPTPTVGDWSPSSVTALSSSGRLRSGGEGSKWLAGMRDVVAARATATKTDVGTFLLKLKNLLLGYGFTTESGGQSKFSKKALTGLGLNALLAYGFVSNVSYITCLILAWVSHGKLTGLSPLAPGQRKQFLAIYGGFWVTNNILRPLRFSLSLVLTPFFNNLIDLVQNKTGFKRPTSTGIVVFLVNVCGTIGYLLLGLFFSTSLAGVPLLP